MATVQDVFDIMEQSFQKDVAAGFKKKVVIQYNIAGEDGGKWYLTIENGEYSITEGSVDKPSAELKFDSVDSFYGVTTGEIGGIKAYTTGKLRFSGSQALLQQINKVFPSAKE
jgi:putative sterol carrier protein